MNFTKQTRSVVIGGAPGIGKAVAGHAIGLDVTGEAAIATYFEALKPVDHVVITAGSSAPGGAVSEVTLDDAKQFHPGGTIEAVAKILAKELTPVRVNVVSPGLTDTEAYSGMDEAARIATLERVAGSLPVGKAGAPEDLVRGYLFAIDIPFVTGSVIDIDGGSLIN